MKNVFTILFLVKICLSCTVLHYTNSFNKVASGERVSLSDTIAIGEFISPHNTSNPIFSDSIFAAFQKVGFQSLVSPRLVENKLLANKIYALPNQLSTELCIELSKILQTQFYLHSFTVSYREADRGIDGSWEIQFDLYDLTKQKLIWSCKSSIEIWVPANDPRETSFYVLLGASQERAFNRLIKRVAQREVPKIVQPESKWK